MCKSDLSTVVKKTAYIKSTKKKIDLHYCITAIKNKQEQKRNLNFGHVINDTWTWRTTIAFSLEWYDISHYFLVNPPVRLLKRTIHIRKYTHRLLPVCLIWLCTGVSNFWKQQHGEYQCERQRLYSRLCRIKLTLLSINLIKRDVLDALLHENIHLWRPSNFVSDVLLQQVDSFGDRLSLKY